MGGRFVSGRGSLRHGVLIKRCELRVGSEISPCFDRSPLKLRGAALEWAAVVTNQHGNRLSDWQGIDRSSSCVSGWLVSERQIVYENTWYLPTEPPSWLDHDHIVPDATPKDSPFLCDFGEIPVPVFDYLSPDPKRISVRVVVHDHPAFFHALAELDRPLLLLQFAHTSIAMLRDGLSRCQYGFPVEVLDEDYFCVLEYPYVEYYFTLITSILDSRAKRPRYTLNMCSGAPPAKTRRVFDKLDDLARRGQQRLEAEDSLEEDL